MPSYNLAEVADYVRREQAATERVLSSLNRPTKAPKIASPSAEQREGWISQWGDHFIRENPEKEEVYRHGLEAIKALPSVPYNNPTAEDLERLGTERMKSLKPELDRGVAGDVGSWIARGGIGAAETGLRALRAVDPEGGLDITESLSTMALKKIEGFKEKTPFLRPKPGNKEGWKRWVSEGIESAVQSLAVGLPSAAAGAAIGAALGGPFAGISAPVGGLIGFATGGGVQFGLAEFDSFLEDAKKAGIPKEKAQTSAVLSGLAEGGFEFATNLIEGALLGITKPLTQPAKQALKGGIKELFKKGWAQHAKRMAGVTGTEMVGEAVTSGTQAELRRNVGLGDTKFWEAAQHALGPAGVASIIFGGLGTGVVTAKQRSIQKALVNKDAKPAERLAAAEEVGRTLKKVDPELAFVWGHNANKAISQKETIDMGEDLFRLQEKMIARDRKADPEDGQQTTGDGQGMTASAGEVDAIGRVAKTQELRTENGGQKTDVSDPIAAAGGEIKDLALEQPRKAEGARVESEQSLAEITAARQAIETGVVGEADTMLADIIAEGLGTPPVLKDQPITVEDIATEELARMETEQLEAQGIEALTTVAPSRSGAQYLENVPGEEATPLPEPSRVIEKPPATPHMGPSPSQELRGVTGEGMKTISGEQREIFGPREGGGYDLLEQAETSKEPSRAVEMLTGKRRKGPALFKIGDQVRPTADSGLTPEHFTGKIAHIQRNPDGTQAIQITGIGQYLLADNFQQISKKAKGPSRAVEMLTGYRRSAPKIKEERSLPGSSDKVAAWVKKKVTGGEEFTWQDLFKKADDAFGGSQAEGKYTPKDAYDGMEVGLNGWIQDNFLMLSPTLSPVKSAQEVVKGLTKKIRSLPTQTKRTAEMDEFQQFSTPPPFAYAANWVANINEEDVVLEPSAGVGGLAVFAKNADPKEVIVNELSPRRADLLRLMGFNRVFTENAEQINNILPKDVRPTVIVMNPPFSATAGRIQGRRKTSEGAKHVEQALERLEPNGRLVAIVGKGMRDDAPAFKTWWKKIKKKYNVRANIGVSGKGYAKYGTTFDNQIIIIDKTGESGENIITGMVNSIHELLPLIEGVRNERRIVERESGRVQPIGEKSPQAGEAESEPGPALQSPAGHVGRGERDGGAGAPGAGRRAGEFPLPVEPGGGLEVSGKQRRGRAVETLTGIKRTGRPGRSGSKPAGQPDERGVRRVSGTSASEELEIEAREKEAKGELQEGLYESYQPERIRIAKAKRHPTPLVQSAAMSAVDPPAATYTPTLPQKSITSGKISDIQLETVVYAGQSHNEILPDESRRGYFVGDGTGVGKGREIAAIIWDNWNKGRKKALWISEKRPLFVDAQRDIEGVGWDPNLIFDHGKTKVRDAIKAGQGVLFTTYDTLRSIPQKEGAKSRMDQIVEWVGKDFDGVIAFDESHNMGNAVAIKGDRGMKKPSAKALAGVDLQKSLPNARVVYVSATGATEVVNLAYAERLGLWGETTAFADKIDFVNKISSGGMAGMEMVAQDMKATGTYTARSLSYDGVKYDRLEHPLTPAQRDIYDKLTEAWQVVLNNMNEALVATGAVEIDARTGTPKTLDARARAAAMSAFWGGHQRFFNQIITAMQLPTVLEDIRKSLDNKESVVIQLVNTMEAAQERALARLSDQDSLEDLDLTPKDSIMQLVQNSFPTAQHEQYADDDGNIRSRIVRDSQENVVENAEAVAMRERLLDELGAIRVPDSPIDMIIDEFGADNVAEITGRKRRVIRKITERGEERVIEKRSRAKASAEADAFMNDKRQVLIFSEAGGTGRSYHADVDVKNQRKRNHYLLQAGWRADKAVQGLGRTHRSNQKQPPRYVLVTTDLKGQKRFLSSIARRLDQLGALTKGQRQTGSQGIFQARDNLESDYAKDGLRQLYEDIAAGRVEGLTAEDVQRQMGLKLIDDQGGLIQNLPAMRQFLNRILSLNVDTMNKVFDAFSERMDAVIQAHVEAGTLDQGLETLKADRIVKAAEEVVHEDDKSGAKTKYIQLNVERPTALLDWTGASAVADRFFRNVKSGKIWAARIRSRTNRQTGAIEDVWMMDSPTYSKQSIRVGDFNDEKWEKIPKRSARPLWERAIDEAPKTTTERVHFVTGALLPVWDRLIGHPRIMRVQTDAGERMIGRLIAPKDLQATLRNLGASATKVDMSPEEIRVKVLDQGYTMGFANGWQMVRRRVSGDNRFELRGPGFRDFENLKKYGVFSERIQWDTRYFLPTGKAGEEAIAAVKRTAPIVDVTPPAGGVDILEEAETRLSIANKKPWPKGFPNAVIHTTVAKLKTHPDYKAAKAGDTEAAIRVVRDFIKPDKARELAKRFPGARLVPVLAVEDAGRNKLPLAIAHAISDITGLPVDADVYQINIPGRTKLKGLDRLLTIPKFDGSVNSGQDYILIDDVVTQGGTIAESRHFIDNAGGKTVAISTLGAGRFSSLVAIRKKTVDRLERKFGRHETEKFLQEYDIAGSLEALTEGQAQQILKFSSLDSLRTRVVKEGYEKVFQADEGPVQRLGISPAPLTITPRNLESLQALAKNVGEWLGDVLPTDVLKRVDATLKPILDLTGRNIARSEKEWGGSVAAEEILGAATIGKFNALIEIAYNHDSTTIQKAVYHESFHVTAKWLLPDKDYNTLLKYFGTEEAAADAFSQFARGRKVSPMYGVPGVIRRIFLKLKKMVETIRKGLQGKGFNRAEDVFEKIWAQEYETVRSGRETETSLSLDRRAKDSGAPKDPYRGLRPGVRSRLEASEGIDKLSFWQKVKKFPEKAKEMRRHFPYLGAEFGHLTDPLRLLESAPQQAKEDAAEKLRDITQGLVTPENKRIFELHLVMDDLAKDIESGLLPEESPTGDGIAFGFMNKNEVEEYRAYLKRLAEEDPRIKEALKKRQKYMVQLKKELVRNDLLNKNVLKDDRYFHHQVLLYRVAKELGEEYKLKTGTSTQDVRLHKKGWQIARKGSLKDYNTEYFESEFEVIAQALSQLKLKETMDTLKERADIFQGLKTRANADNVDKLWEELRQKGRIEVDKKTGQEKSPLLPFKQQIAMANAQLAKMAAAGELDYIDKYTSIIEALADSHHEHQGAKEAGGGAAVSSPGVNDPQWFPFLAHLLSDKREGAVQAAIIFKAIRDRNAFIKETLGRSFKTWRDFVPEGYVAWQPKPEGVWFKTNVITDQMLEEFREGTRGIPEKVQKVWARVAGREWVVPKELAMTMDEFRKPPDDHFISSASRFLMSAWKQWTLINPYRIIKYNLNNMSGDIDIALAYSPKIVSKYLLPAAKDLGTELRGKPLSDKLKAELKEAKGLDITSSGWAMQEVTDVTGRLSHDEYMGMMLGEKPNLIKKFWQKSKDFTVYRENILRLASWRYFKDEIATGRRPGKDIVGASNREEINKLAAHAAPVEVAAKLARELVGDYGNISHAGSWIRQHMIPFYSWMEINAPRYVRLMQNLPHEGKARSQAVGMLGVRLGWKTAMLGAKAGMLLALVALWNKTFFPDEDDELGEAQRRQMHLILGRRGDGSIISLRFQGALSDALAWFGAEDITHDIGDVAMNKGTVGEKLGEAVKSPFIKLIHGFRPDAKTAGEVLLGRTLYPDPSFPRPIRDKWEYVARTFSLQMPYKWVAGKPQRGDDVAEKLFNDVLSLGFYTSDPGESAYWDIKKAGFDFLEKRGKDRPGIIPSDKANALYYYKQALRYGDLSAAEKYLTKYAELGGTLKGMKISVEASAPVAGIPVTLREEFLGSLTAEQRKSYGLAVEWYQRTFQRGQKQKGLRHFMSTMGANKQLKDKFLNPPITRSGMGEDPVLDFVERLIQTGKLTMGPPNRTVSMNGTVYRMNAEQYERYMERSSAIARRKIAVLMNVRLSDGQKAKRIGAIIKGARKRVRGGIKREILRGRRHEVKNSTGA